MLKEILTDLCRCNSHKILEYPDMFCFNNVLIFLPFNEIQTGNIFHKV